MMRDQHPSPADAPIPARVACYARFSSDLQRSTSIDDQLAAARRYAESRGWTVLREHVYTDEGISGASIQGRPGLLALLGAARRTPPPFDVVLVDDSSRISRDTADAVRVMQELKFRQVRVIYLSQGIDTVSEQAEPLIAMHGLVDSLYLREMAKKIKRGLRGQLERGYHTGGKTYGYRTIPVPDPSGRLDPNGGPALLGKRIEVEPAEARVIVQMFEWFVAGVGPFTIVSRLNRSGVTGPRGGRWSASPIRRMLQNERYLGRQVYGMVRFEREPGTSRKVQRPVPREQWAVNERPDLRIVSDELWRAVQARRHEVREALGLKPGSNLARGRNAALYSRHLFSGLMRCSVCGGPVSIVHHGHGSPRYGCARYARAGVTACANRMTIRAKVLEPAILDRLRLELLQPDTIRFVTDRVAAALNARLNTQADRRKVQAADVERIDRRLRHLVRAIEEGGASSTLLAQIAERERERADLVAELAETPEAIQNKLAVMPQWVRHHLSDLAGLLHDDPDRTKAEFRRIRLDVTLQPRADAERSHYRAIVRADLLSLAQTLYLPGPAVRRSDPQSAR